MVSNTYCFRNQWHRKELLKVQARGSGGVISVNHVNNVMDVYIQSNQKHFFLYLALLNLSSGSWISLWICSNARTLVFLVPLWCWICFYTFQNAERSFGCCYRGWHCKQNLQYSINIRIQSFVYKFVGCNSQLNFHLLTSSYSSRVCRSAI